MGSGILSRIIGYVRDIGLNTKDSKRDFTAEHQKLECNVYFITRDMKRIGAYLLKPAGDCRPRFAIALHGRGCSRECYRSESKIGLLCSMGYYVLIPDYRGFADSEGVFEIEKVNLDIMACFEYLMGNFGANEIDVVAHSLGTGILAEYCRYVRSNGIEECFMPRCAVMISPFMSVMDVVLESFAWRLLCMLMPWARRIVSREIGYDVMGNIKHMNKNALFIYHGTRDDVISCKHAYILSEMHGLKLRLSNHDHVSILDDDELWKGIYVDFVHG
ncbi:hypothetical protein HK407_01g01220 [Ordospora pajunii]|jgi:hypothetical protein|uniref:uncharacterized protein n=1 Tax=Ordospora pajunii TaxID=3039483 RepID=UPI0029526E85|nr:uncharacterized protein HK407_01g01220 [Ordospora pajunii]KAH9412229.1 hypothetical protein HK407_01g01220 [Ordospora pajunii]